ncbi:hypothetical protein FOQG_16193 [Fusarium oxysporum f. sp. raphani 54005]|uniref:Uncharacterized protein n=1 Tax=Fusarium oxysporum f. sp. raphani 54005 TaxID=1089458 RepID=X0BL61_FUSOX|nr:hypothetical protein FOQG_16193 [Fusarium oxysporum f. sp. raphani 54005]
MDPNLELYRSILHFDPIEQDKRMQHRSPLECMRVRDIVEREERVQMLENALFGRAPLYNDECNMVARLMGNRLSNGDA